MPRDIERRIIPTAVEVRAKASGENVLVGYAALYDTLSEDLGGFREKLKKGCFSRALQEKQDVLARAEHDSRLLLGRTSSGTLRLSADDKGLRYEVDCPDTQAGRDIAELVRRGDVKQSSFAFIIPDPKENVEWDRSEDGEIIRTILDVDLVDVAPVAMPAYTETTVSARAIEEARAVKAPVITISNNSGLDPKALVSALEEALGGSAGSLTRAIALPSGKREAFARTFAAMLAARRIFDRAASIEKREASYEDKIAAIWNELYEKLGYPWREGGCCWCLVATYPEKVVVEMEPGQYVAYPVSFDKANSVTLGDPVAVEKTWAEIPGVVVGDEPGPGDGGEGGPAAAEDGGDRAAAIAALRRRNDHAGAA